MLFFVRIFFYPSYIDCLYLMFQLRVVFEMFFFSKLVLYIMAYPIFEVSKVSKIETFIFQEGSTRSFIVFFGRLDGCSIFRFFWMVETDGI